MNEIIKPNGGQDKKIVDINNKPIKKIDDAIAADAKRQVQQNIIAAMRDMADRMESGELPMPEHVVVMPSFENGETQLLFLGPQIPSLMLLGIMHKITTRMALQ
jgi:hypothetical protein